MASKAVTQADVNRYSSQIFNQARAGTGVNPGLPVTLANLVVAQARHETGSFTSNAFVKHNNAFGYSYVAGGKYQTGPGLVADNGQPVANYATLNNSVKELVDWIYRRRKEGKFPQDLATIKTPEEYASLLKGSNYFGDTISNYLKGLQSFFKDLSGSAKAGGLGILVALVIGATWFMLRR